MRLNELLEGIYDGPLPGPFDRLDISGLFADSREVSPGGVFVALPGVRHNGADYIPQAAAQGARVIVADNRAQVPRLPADILVVRSGDVLADLARLAGRFFDQPDRRMICMGVTGTNGKTTLTYLIESILGEAGKRCGVIGTVNARCGSAVHPVGNTTPGLLENYRLLAEMAGNGATYAVMEVSSHALVQRRVEGIDFRYGVFTNLTSDHLDYHRDRESYFQAKSLLFRTLREEAKAVINMDDPYGRRLADLGPGRLVSYGINHQAGIRAEKIATDLNGARFLLTTPGGDIPIETGLTGLHNVYNILAAAAVCLAEEIPAEIIQRGIRRLKAVPGRLEKIEEGQDFHVFIDYAHTEDALQNVLSSLRPFVPGRMIVVFGCGGDRDRTKRPKMGRVACRMADHAIVTSDNPRSEDPLAIIEEVRAGFDRDNYEVVADRREAIVRALDLAKAGDAVLIAGKGHEDYQIFKDETVPFREQEIVREHLGRKRKT